MISIALLIIFLLFLIIGFPVTFAMLSSSLLCLVIGGYPLHVIPQVLERSLDNFTLMAIPFFLLAGNIMNTMNLTERLFAFARALVGHFIGGLAHVNVLASMIFAGISGSSSADCAGLGVVEITAMKAAGYRKRFSAAVTLASSTLGLIIPPSIGLIVYGAYAGASIAKLFLAGVLPGVVIGVMLSSWVYFVAATGREPCPVEKKKNIKEIWVALKRGILAVFTPVIILYGMTGGLVTPTEAGALACVYCLIVGLIYGEFKIKNIRSILTETVLSTAHIFLLLAAANLMGYILTQERAAIDVGNWLVDLTTNKHLVLLLIITFLLLIGCVEAGIAPLIILTPIFLPVIHNTGIDPIHFGVVMVYALSIGMMTPPVGVGLYIVSDVANVKYEDLVVAILPFLIPIMAALLIITFIPEVSLFLPKLLMK